MNSAQILVRPILTEKVNAQMEKAGRYSFEIARFANKLEVKRAVEEFYGVKVEAVNTMRIPAKTKSRFTKAGLLRGRKSGYKKAIVTLVAGETIDLFS
jgi:large subunit ribosomal protein L23